MPRLVVCLPCYNEAVALPRLLARLEAVAGSLPDKWRLEALVVDDGSSDQTSEAVATVIRLSCHLLQHPVNLGLGRTLADGVAWFIHSCREEDALAVMDADQTHPPELLPQMLGLLASRPADVVIASRYARGGSEKGLSAARLAYSRLANALLRRLARLPGVRDYTCGYRLYSAAILRRADSRFKSELIEEPGFVCMAELLLKLSSCGARCAEVPLALDYGLKTGQSKMNVPDTIRRYARLCFRLIHAPWPRQSTGGKS